MRIYKRSGATETFNLNKLKRFIEFQSKNLRFSSTEFADKIARGLCEDATTSEIVDYMAETAATCITIHPDYAELASRVAIFALHKKTLSSFSEKIEILYNHTNNISNKIYEIVMKNAKLIDGWIDYSRDSTLSYFGLQTLKRGYLLRRDNLVFERPQDMLMRVAIEIHQESLDDVKETYELMSKKYFLHATPTLFNSCTSRSQLSSCFLISIGDDSCRAIFKAVSDAASISKHSGGIGINISHIRAANSPLATGGSSNGIIPMIRVFEMGSRFISQGGNKRNSSIAVFLEPWHAEIEDFIDLRKNTGKEEMRCRSIFTALWVPDLFMKRVEEDKMWSLFCPNIAKGLNLVYGDEFDALYEKYEEEGLANKVLKARYLWKRIIEAQIETGTPYILYKDAINKKSNQKNVGVIKCSNLCAEIVEFTDKDEIAVCNLAAIALPMYVENGVFDYEKLISVTKVIVKNLDNVIDRNYYPVAEAKNSNFKHRPMGIGIQGLADVFAMMKIPFESEEAKKVNKCIFETIYYAAVNASCDLARNRGVYESYEGSPAQKGVLQFDMWNVKPEMYDWEETKNRVKQYGMRNSLLVALMPTATTSQILGFNECFEPFTSNVYTRRTIAGEFQIINKYLLEDLISLNLWTPELKNQLIQNEGSVQNILSIPKNIRALYKTAWEMEMRHVVEMAIARAPFVDQSQSLNIFMAQPTYVKMTSMHFKGWKGGLKTGMYYLRTQPIAAPNKFTVDKVMLAKNENKICNLDGGDCEACSS